MKTAHNGISSEKGFSPIAVILLIVVVAAVGGYFVLSKNQQSTNSSSSTNTPQSQQNKLANLTFKEVNEFFPKSLNGNQVRSTGIETYTVAPMSDTEYKRAGAKPEDRVAKISSGFLAFYGPEGGNIEKIVKDKTIRIVYTKFPNNIETEDARLITDNIFSVLTEGFTKVTLPLENISYWAAYREVPTDKAADNFSGDARIIFSDSLTMIRIDVAGGYTLDEFKTIVKTYVGSLLNDSTQYVSKNELLTSTRYSEILDEERNASFNKKVEQEKQKARQEFEEEVKKMQQNFPNP